MSAAIKESKHTPGPWMVCPELSAFEIRSESPKARTKLGDTHVIASATFSDNAPISADEFAANAKLIAAAPEMAEALNRAMETLCEIERALLIGETRTVVENGISNLRAALAKAGL